MRVFLAETLHRLQRRLVSTDLRFLHLDVNLMFYGVHLVVYFALILLNTHILRSYSNYLTYLEMNEL